MCNGLRLKAKLYNYRNARTANMGLAKVAVQCSTDTFVLNQTFVLRINICGENRHLRQALNVMPNAMTTVQPTN